MKLLTTAALVGMAAAAVTPEQQVLQNPLKGADKPSGPGSDSASSSMSSLLGPLADGLKSMSSEAKAAWDEVSMLFPEQVSQASFLSSPKPSKRRPDAHWDHILKGADVQAMTVQNKQGEKVKAIDGHLESYNLRAKSVDPSKLGVDTVKQFSGYLDDDANDKHLFYCKCVLSRAWLLSNAARVL